jgi:hypothetical protein
MNAAIFSKTAIALALTASVFTVNLAFAEVSVAGRGHYQHHKGVDKNYKSVDKSYSSMDQDHKIVARHSDKTKTENGFVRKISKTDAEGKTAERTTTVINNKEEGTRTHTVVGTTFEGKAYSGESVVQKTDNGFTTEQHFTGPDGKTMSRSVTGVVDKDAGTVTKNISLTEDGETSTRVVVTDMPRRHHGEERSE